MHPSTKTIGLDPVNTFATDNAGGLALLSRHAALLALAKAAHGAANARLGSIVPIADGFAGLLLFTSTFGVIIPFFLRPAT